MTTIYRKNSSHQTLHRHSNLHLHLYYICTNIHLLIFQTSCSIVYATFTSQQTSIWSITPNCLVRLRGVLRNSIASEAISSDLESVWNSWLYKTGSSLFASSSSIFSSTSPPHLWYGLLPAVSYVDYIQAQDIYSSVVMFLVFANSYQALYIIHFTTSQSFRIHRVRSGQFEKILCEWSTINDPMRLRLVNLQRYSANCQL